MKLSPEVERYVKAIGKIGENIGKVSRHYFDVDLDNLPTDYEGLLKIKRSYEQGVREYKQLLTELNTLITPIFLDKEHKEMVDAFILFINASDEMISAIDLEKRMADKAKIESGYKKDELAVSKVKQATDRIVNKIMANA
ncbi:hypothetical protein [Shouchella tritolerans]|uniref:hypothetical protein n=1 Tax=Shouchella tritolerans TaxID=2979466 RepID=UPI0021E76FE2|nr:hypothetical protein [Shouchella tritolerans]